jgi:hypothetical protein
LYFISDSLVFIFHVLSSGSDPCNKDNHVVLKDETLRSFNQPIDEDHGALCDQDLDSGWYQFQSLAGTTIPTGCPAINHCGTHYPIWLRGKKKNIYIVPNLYNLLV